jgi:hypothetical protein
MPKIIVPQELVVQVSEMNDAGEIILLPEFMIVGNRSAVKKVGQTLFGYPNNEDPATPNARSAFEATFAGPATQAVINEVPEASVVDNLPANWRPAQSI